MRNLFLCLLVLIMLSSCGNQRRLASTKQALIDIKAQQESEINKITEISKYSINKISEGKIDSNVSNRIKESLKKYREDAEATKRNIMLIDSLLANKKNFNKKYYEAYILPLLDSLQKRTRNYNERLSVYAMVEEGLNVANYKLFDLAAFFGPGVYTIPADKEEMTRASFAPIIDSIIVFANKYSGKPRKASVIILGYADAAGFAMEGPLFDTLSGLIGQIDVTKEQLNQKLSELRALELSKQLTKIFSEKTPYLKEINNLKIEYIYQGKGEAYPFNSIKDYTVDDPRRRIALCYWVVLPD